MSRVRVLVTSATSDAALAAIRSLARSGYDVVSADVRAMPLGIRSRFATSHSVLDNTTPDTYEASLLKLVGDTRPDVMLPIGSRAVAASVRIRGQLDQMTALSLPSATAIAAANDKSASMASFQSLDIACAKVYGECEARDLAATGVSLVVKPNANVGAARGVIYVNGVTQLDDALQACRERYSRAVIQEYIPGRPDAMKTAVLLFSDAGELTAAFTTQKRRQWPPTGGLTVVSESTDDSALVKQVLPFFDKWQWKGPAEVELKHDSRDGLDKVIEINPRFPAYLRFAGRCGLDLPTFAARLASGATVTPRKYPDYSVGVTYMKPGLFIKNCAWHLRQSGVSVIPGALRELMAGFPCVIDMLSDPFPFLGRAVEDFRGVLVDG